MCAVLAATVFLDLFVAVGVGVVMSCFVLLKRRHRLQRHESRDSQRNYETKPLSPEEIRILKTTGGRLTLVRLAGPLNFGTATGMVKLLSCEKDCEVLVLDLSDVPVLDYTVARIIEDAIVEASSEERDVVIAVPKGTVRELLVRLHILERLPEVNACNDRMSALRCGTRCLGGSVLDRPSPGRRTWVRTADRRVG
jgi:SulP family sulfate permease